MRGRWRIYGGNWNVEILGAFIEDQDPHHHCKFLSRKPNRQRASQESSMKRIKQTAFKFLRSGLRPSGIAAAISLGIVMGVFPIYGPISVLCLALAALFRLNLPIAFAAYYSMTFTKPILIIPFLRMGEFLFQADPMPMSLAQLTTRFVSDARGTLSEFGWSFVHAMAGWLFVAPFLIGLLYPVTLVLANRWSHMVKAGIAVPSVIVLLLVSSSVDSLSATPPPDYADEPFIDSLLIDGRTFELNGVGVLRYARFFPVYDAALYLGEAGAKRLEVVYRVNAKAIQFAKAGAKILARNYSSDELAPLQERLDQINSWYPDPEEDDHCAITYLPGKGTELTFNGELLGTVPGEDFARLYFSIWLGNNPACPRLRKDLLNDKQTKEDIP